MSLNIENNFFNIDKENNFIQTFIKEVSNYLGNKGNSTNNLELKQENKLYQVVEKTSSGAYLEDLTTHRVFEEKQLSDELYNKIADDSVLKLENGKYILEEKMTKDFLNNLVKIDEYSNIFNEFIDKNNLSLNNTNIIFEVQDRTEDMYILSYIENNQNKILEVPEKIIPYWTKIGDKLICKNNEFCIY